jgi:hypothetical protein
MYQPAEADAVFKEASDATSNPIIKKGRIAGKIYTFGTKDKHVESQHKPHFDATLTDQPHYVD